MISPKNIASLFPDLAVGEVIFVCSNGVWFNKGTEAERQTRARRYCERLGLPKPEKVVGVSSETEEPKAATKKRTSKNK